PGIRLDNEISIKTSKAFLHRDMALAERERIKGTLLSVSTGLTQTVARLRNDFAISSGAEIRRALHQAEHLLSNISAIEIQAPTTSLGRLTPELLIALDTGLQTLGRYNVGELSVSHFVPQAEPIFTGSIPEFLSAVRRPGDPPPMPWPPDPRPPK